MNIKLFKKKNNPKTPQKTKNTFAGMLCFVWVQSFSFSQGGTWWCHTLWQVSAICLDCFSTWQIWGFLFPIQPPTQSLSRKFVMHVQCMKEREREKKHLSKAFFEKRKSFPLFSEQKREQVSWLERVKKMWKPPSLWWMVRRRQLQTTYQTLCT